MLELCKQYVEEVIRDMKHANVMNPNITNLSFLAKQYPFIVGVTLDSNEQVTAAGAAAMAGKVETGMAPGIPKYWSYQVNMLI